MIEAEWIVARDLSDPAKRLGHVLAGPAANATDAIRLAATQTPDLILMDIQLDGLTAVTEILRRRAIPVISITANSHIFLKGDAEGRR